MKPAQGSRLDSWKEIANYVGRNERTVMRWADRGLPVHRVPGGNRRTVFALTAEIDAWMLGQENASNGGEGQQEERSSEGGASRVGLNENQNQIPRSVGNDSREATSHFRLTNWMIAWGLAAIIIATGAGALRLTQTARGSAARIDSIALNVDKLEAKDEEGRTLWSQSYDRPFVRGLDLPISAQPTMVADFFRDGRQEVVASVETKGPNRDDADFSEVDFFSGDGHRLWRYVPEMTVRFGEYQVGPPWSLADMHLVQSGGRNSVYVVEQAHTWGNSVVEELDPKTGKNRLRFVNTGALYVVDYTKTENGSFLIAGGFNNEWDGAGLAIWDAKKPFVASPQTHGTRHECKSCAAGAPDYYFVFPRSELNRLSHSYNLPVYELDVTGEGIEVFLRDRLGLGRESTVYLLAGSPPFRVKSMRVETEYLRLHKQWSDEGKLSHRYEDCPELLHPLPVKVWTPTGGWTEIQVPGTKAN
ncbi:MAG: helix-turn-helix domain-containing protein [Acidobacteria bacterium]|nr:helix-turn-helix domain-containing protein [Acidobacteriota bacterium]MBS1865034.1 helix-turn-helix domain-containing protein [Acidobacteriota bacterium]